MGLIGSTPEQINLWYRHEVLTHPNEYPFLFELLKKQNAWKFQHERREHTR